MEKGDVNGSTTFECPALFPLLRLTPPGNWKPAHRQKTNYRVKAAGNRPKSKRKEDGQGTLPHALGKRGTNRGPLIVFSC